MEKATITQKTKIVVMLDNSCFSPAERDAVKQLLPTYTSDKANRVIAELIIKICERTGAEVNLKYFDYEVQLIYKKKCLNTYSPTGRSTPPNPSESNAA